MENDTINVYEGTKSIDILKGSKLIKNGSEKHFSGVVALDDVTQLELEEFDTLLTIGSIVIPLGLFIWAVLNSSW